MTTSAVSMATSSQSAHGNPEIDLRNNEGIIESESTIYDQLFFASHCGYFNNQ
jgi:hypothetical protein